MSDFISSLIHKGTPQLSDSSYRSYLVAVVATVAVLLLRLSLDFILGDTLPLLFMSAAVLVAGWHGGFKPAMVATFLGLIGSWYLLLPYRNSFMLADSRDAFRLTLFLIFGFMISVLTGLTHSTMQRSRKAEGLFRRTLVNAPFPVILHNEDGQVLAISREFMARAGYALQDIPTIHSWTEKAYGKQAEEKRASIRALYGIEAPVDGGEHTIRTSSGETRIWAFRSSSMGTDEQGRRLVLSVADDVTERRRAEQDRAATHTRLQAILDSLHDGLAVMDQNWVFTYFSQTGAGMLNLRAEDLVGERVWDVFPEAVQRRFYTELHEAVATGIPRHFEEYYPEPLNLWLECHCYPSAEELSVYFRDITARKQTEETLRQRTAELDSLLENAPIGFAFFDREFRFLRLNNRLAEINGSPVEAYVGRPIRDVLPENAESVEPVLQQVFESAAPLQREIAGETLLSAGATRYWLTGFFPVQKNGHGVVSVGAFVVETTEQHKAEQALMETNERLRLALDSARMGTFEIHFLSNLIFWDERSGALFDMPGTQEVKLERAISCVHPEDRNRVRHAINTAFKVGSNGHYEVEYRLLQAQGAVRWVYSIGQAYFEQSDGQVLPGRLIGVNNDVTERKLAELALAEGEERFRIAANAAQLGLFEWDLHSGQSFWHNPRMYEIFGRTPEEGPIDYPTLATRSFHRDDIPALRNALEDSRRTGTPFRIALRIHRQDGQRRWIRMEGTLRKGPDGSSDRLLAIAQDITEARELEQALRRNEAYLSAVFEGLPLGVAATDRSGNMVSMNKVCLELHGFESSHEMYSSIEEYRAGFEILRPDGTTIPHDDWPILRASRGEYVSDFEAILRNLNTGVEHLVSYTGVPVRGDDEALNIFVIQDVRERREAEQQIRASEAQYRALFDSIDQGFCVVEVLFDQDQRPYDYVFIEANPAFERHTGLVGVVGRHVREMIPDLSNVWYKVYGHVAVTGEPIRFENHEPALNRTFEVYAFRAGAPGERRVALLFSDITARKEYEASIRAAHRETESQRLLLDAILESLPVGVIIADANGKLLRWNKANENLWGLHGVDPAKTENIQAYREWRGWWPDTGRQVEPHEWAMARALLSREVATGELIEIERFDGTGRRFMVHMGAPVLDKEGNVIAAVIAQTDVTDRVNIEIALRESEDKFRTISDNIPQLAWMTDELGRGLWYNKRWLDYTGMMPSMMEPLPGLGSVTPIDTSVGSSIAHPDDWNRVSERWKHSLLTGQPYEIEFRCRRYDGVYRWFLGRALPIRDLSGNIVRWFGTNTDIHAQKAAEDALRRSNEDLQQFAYVASHDLQEPLRTVVSFSQMLSRRYSSQLEPQAKDYLRYVTEAGLRMSNLVRDLLLYSRTTREGDKRPAPVALDDVLADVMRNLRTQLEETRAGVSAAPLPIVIGDAMQLGQVLQNLISNAIKYRRPGVRPEVRIEGERRRGEWLISVSDNGQGFEQEFADRIFGIFKRLHGRDVPGTGIGLAICKTVIERHGGRIWAESRKGQGTTIFFTLPSGEAVAA